MANRRSTRELPPPSALPRRSKAERGATTVEETPLAIRSGVPITHAFRDEMRRRLGAKLGVFAKHIERASLRMLDVNGPRGGVDTRCRIDLVVSGRPRVVVEELAASAENAFAGALAAVDRALRRTLGRAGRTARKARRVTRAERFTAPGRSRPRDDEGSLIGRRVGNAPANLERALDRPEKLRRDAYVDTSAPATSATDRKAGYGATAARNTKREAPRAAYALEDSRRKPSRKSTRRSANRQKAATPKERTRQLAVSSPPERAARSKARGR